MEEEWIWERREVSGRVDNGKNGGTGNCSWNVLKTINKHFKLETRAAVAKGMRVGLQQTKELITAE